MADDDDEEEEEEGEEEAEGELRSLVSRRARARVGYARFGITQLNIFSLTTPLRCV